MNTPFSPRPSLQHLPESSFSGRLEEDPLDSSFSFMNDYSFEYFTGSPNMQGEQSHMSPIHPQPQGHEEHVDTQHLVHTQSPPPSATFPMSTLSLGGTSQQAGQVPTQYPLPSGLPLYNPFDHTGQHLHHTQQSQSFSGSYHPYRQHGLRSNRLSRSPEVPRPTSPSFSLSPPGSASSRLGNSPSAVSPSLVSPMSIPGASLSDTSPQQWSAYSLPNQLIYTGTPLTSISNLSNVSPPIGATMMGMVGGFPYRVPTPHSGSTKPRPFPGMRPRMRGRANTSASVKREKEEEDEGGSSDAEGEDELPSSSSRPSGLGLEPTDNNMDARVPVEPREDEIRKTRIESEQRRRDELRQGFTRLKDALPPSNQRASKSNLLDRGESGFSNLMSRIPGNHADENQL